MNKKRYIALVVCMVLIISTMFTSCGKKEKNDKTKDPTPTITEQVTGEAEPSPTEPAATPTQEPTPGTGTDGNDPKPETQSVLTLDSGDAFDKYLNELYISLISADAFSLHYKIENPEKYNIEAKSAFGDVNSLINEDFIKEIQANLDRFEYDKLTDSQKVKYSLLEYELSMFKKDAEDKAPYIYALSQNNNFISNLQQYFTEFSVQNKKDAELFLKLFEQVPNLINTEKEYIDKLTGEGKKITKEMYDYSLELIDAWNYEKASDGIIYIAFENNLKEAKLSADDTKEVLSSLEKILDEKVKPAIDDYRNYVKGLDKYIVKTQGAASYEGGKEYYEFMLEAYLGTGVSVDDLYNYTLKRYNAYWDRMTEIAKEHPLITSTISLTKSKYSDNPAEIMNELAKLAGKEFPDVGNPSWTISYLDKRQEVDTISAYYLPPQLDNIGRRVIRVNGSNISDSINLFTTLAHEGMPGHLYQDEFNFRKKDYQEIDSALTYLGYQEGWAMYVEKLAFNWCVDNELKAELLNIDNVINYTLVSLIDMGVNYYGWDLATTKKWLKDQGLPETTADYIYGIVSSDPAIYPAYGVGYLLMEDTVEALHKSGTDYKECYNKILTVGASPYSILWKYLGIDPIAQYK